MTIKTEFSTTFAVKEFLKSVIVTQSTINSLVFRDIGLG